MDATRPSTESVWSQLGDDLRRFIRRRVADDHAADDLLQETFMRVHLSLPALQETDRLAAWVYQIARNVIHDHHRKEGATAPLAPLEADDLAADQEEALAEEQQTELRRRAAGWLGDMVRQLPDGYREAVQLSEIEGLPQREVAERLGLSLSGAKSRIQRGRAMLADILDRCCSFELDRRGNILDYQRRRRCACRKCEE